MRRNFLACGLALLVTACAGVVPLPTGERSYRDVVTLGGRLSVRYEEAGKPQSVQGKFRWAQGRESTEIELYSPLGQTIARIAILPDRATLETTRGAARSAPSADALTEEMLGWPLPVQGMRYWLQGFARTGQRVLPAAAPSGPDRFRSDGWQIRIAGWQAAGDTALPKRIDLEREAGDDRGGPITLRLVIDEWAGD